MDKRKSGHASKARTGSCYPYHDKIRELGGNWDIEELMAVPDEEVADHEEYYIIKLTLEGHALLNIKRGDVIKKELTSAFSELKKNGVLSSKDYARLKINNRNARIAARETKQIERALIHLGLHENQEERLWQLGEEKFSCDRFLSRKEIALLKSPSETVELNHVISKIEHTLRGL